MVMSLQGRLTAVGKPNAGGATNPRSAGVTWNLQSIHLTLSALVTYSQSHYRVNGRINMFLLGKLVYAFINLIRRALNTSCQMRGDLVLSSPDGLLCNTFFTVRRN